MKTKYVCHGPISPHAYQSVGGNSNFTYLQVNFTYKFSLQKNSRKRALIMTMIYDQQTDSLILTDHSLRHNHQRV